MIITRIFQCGNSQTVQLLQEFRVDAHRVEIFRRGKDLVLRAVSPNASVIFATLAQLPSDFMEGGRGDSSPQKRNKV